MPSDRNLGVTAGWLAVRESARAGCFGILMEVFPKIVGNTPQIIHSKIGFSIINHPIWGTIIFGNTHMGNIQSYGDSDPRFFSTDGWSFPGRRCIVPRKKYSAIRNSKRDYYLMVKITSKPIQTLFSNGWCLAPPTIFGNIDFWVCPENLHSAPEKWPSPNRKGSSSNHHFSGAALNFRGVSFFLEGGGLSKYTFLFLRFI